MQEAMTAECFHRKAFRQTKIVGDRLRFQINRQFIRRLGLRLFSDATDQRLFHFDEQQTVVARVGAKDIGIRWRDDGAKAKLRQRPGGVFSRGAATKILSGYQNACRTVMLLVEHEVVPGRSIAMKAPAREEVGAETDALDALQMLLGDDLVGVDVLPQQRRNSPAMLAKRFHLYSLLLVMPATHIDEVSRDSGGRGCGWAHQMGASFAALTPFEVPVAGGGAALRGRQNVRIHAQAHRASGLAPLGASLDENAIQPLALGL